MTISKTRREEIERNWRAESSFGFGRGHPLCSFAKRHAEELIDPFKKVWDSRTPLGLGHGYMYMRTPGYMDEYLGEMCDNEEAYLLRALTLNMLLDDNEGEHDD